MNQVELETLVVASVLTESVKPGPVISTALAYADYWKSDYAGRLAKGILKVTLRGFVPSRSMVRAAVEPEYKPWLDHPMFGQRQSMPLWIVEHQAKELLPCYRNQRLVEAVARTYERMLDKPESARDLALALKLQLEDLL